MIIQLLDVPADLDEKSKQVLGRSMAQKLKGEFDYFRFKLAVKELVEMDMEEEMAMRSVFTTAKTLGLNKTDLLGSLDHYLEVLRTEKTQFDNALREQIDERIARRKEKGEQILAEIANLKAEIKKLTAKTEKLKVTYDSLDDTIDRERAKLQERKSSFESVYNEIIRRITDDKDKMDARL